MRVKAVLWAVAAAVLTAVYPLVAGWVVSPASFIIAAGLVGFWLAAIGQAPVLVSMISDLLSPVWYEILLVVSRWMRAIGFVLLRLSGRFCSVGVWLQRWVSEIRRCDA